MAKILAIRFSALGDVAMTVPIITTVAERYPMHHFTILSKKNMAPLFEYLPENVDFRGIDVNNYNGFFGLLRLYKELKKEKYDLIADLHDVLRSKVLRTLFQLEGKRVAVINKDRKAREALTRQSNKQFFPMKTSSERYADVFATLDCPINLSIHPLFGNRIPPLPAEVSELMGTHNGNHWIGIAPFARHKGKIYPLEKMKEVLQLLNKHTNTKIFLFGFGDEEKAWCQQCESDMENVYSLVSKFGLQKELILMSHLDVMLTMDSGNMHLAALTNTPVVSIWGATHPYAGFSGLQPEGSIKVQQEMPCRPCSIFGDKPCFKETYDCLYSITPQMVADAVVNVINKKGSENE